MNCGRAKKELSLYVDGRLAKARADELRLHADGCPSCGRELRRLDALKGSLSSMPKAEVSPAFKVAFLQALDRNWRKVIRRPDFFEQLVWAFRMGQAVSARRMARVAVPVMSIFFVVAFWSMAPKDADRHVSLIRGNAYVSAISIADWRAGREADIRRLEVANGAAYGCVLSAGDGPATVNISDKIILRIDRGTEVYVARPQEGVFSLGLRHGQVYARTTEGFKGSGLSVITPFSRSSVTGTEFIVQAWPGGSETRVLAGSVKVENVPLSEAAASRAVIVRAGEKSEVLEGAASPSLARAMIAAERNAVRRFAGKDMGRNENSRSVSVDSRRYNRDEMKSLVPGLF